MPAWQSLRQVQMCSLHPLLSSLFGYITDLVYAGATTPCQWGESVRLQFPCGTDVPQLYKRQSTFAGTS
jgi:hypothetical protein